MTLELRVVRIIGVYVSLICAFVFALILSVNVECKKMYLHIHLMVFVISLLLESITRYCLVKKNKNLLKTTPRINSGLFWTVSRTIALLAWHFTLLSFTSLDLIRSCTLFVVIATALCIIFFAYSIHEFVVNVNRSKGTFIPDI